MKFMRLCMILACLAFMLFICSCEKSLVFEKNEKLSGGQWDQNDKIDFDVMINDTAEAHNFYINIRHGGNYQFSNIFMFISTKMPDGKSFRDTLECTLAADDGKWYGSGIGDIRDVRILFKRNLIFPLKGKYHFGIEQAMRMSPLPYVFDVGIRVEKANVKEEKSIRSFFRFQENAAANVPGKK
jgi:gliding motility-associated lipoprotein GldH